MSDVGNWEPNSHFNLEESTVDRLLHAAREHQLAPADEHLHLSEDEIRTLAPVMTLDAAIWRRTAEALKSEQLVELIKLFTLAEARLPGWEAGDKSPVITLVTVLKHRGQYPPDLTAWIKGHSENRFLPYGNLMHRL